MESTVSKPLTQSPLVVIGSGFHHWLRGRTAENGLSSWAKLLAEISQELRVAIPPRMNPSLTLAWEELLLRMVREGYRRPGKKAEWAAPWSRSVSEAEDDARRTAKDLLIQAKKHQIDQWGRARQFRDLPLDGVISLNFDLTWIDVATPKFEAPTQLPKKERSDTLANAEFDRLYRRTKLPNDRPVWFPNGAAERGGPDIRLGLRDFGLQMQTLQHAFVMFKAWEREVVGADGAPSTPESYLKLLDRFSKGEGKRFAQVDNWVSRFLLRPVLILGAGLSMEEQGMWWLLVQRARNLARVEGASPVRILLNTTSMDKEKRLSWNRKAAIIKPIWCDDWDAGWQRAFQIIRRQASKPVALSPV